VSVANILAYAGPKAGYCVSPEQHDAQIRENLAQGYPQIEPHPPCEEPLAIACFGPSLQDTWKEIRNFSHVMTCSGAHRFLTELGIVPTHHVDVDPRSHKAQLIGDALSPRTDFLMASCCHPSVLQHIKDHHGKVTLWHAIDNIGPPIGTGWALYGGSTAGLRTLTVAAFLGYRSLHIFGMDGSFKDSRHAAPHPRESATPVWASYKGKRYLSTSSLVAEANDLFRIIPSLTGVSLTFYGEGLIQDRASHGLPARDPQGVIATYYGAS